MEPEQQDPVTLGLEHRVTMMDQGSIERFMTQVTDQALEVVDLKRQWKEYEEAYALMEENVRKHVLEAKKKEEESDMKDSLEAHVMMLSLEVQTEEEVAKKHEELKKEVQVKKEELEARENELKKREEELEAKRKSLEVKEKNFEELMRELEERQEEESTEIEKRNQKQEAEAREIEVKRHSLEEREELLKWKKKKRELDKRAKSRKRSRDEMAEKDDGGDEDPEPYCCPDADFNSFNNNTISSSVVGQIWALYDPSDEMPRYYARIRKVLEPQLRVGIRWLESKPVPIACGEFKYGEKTTSSHLMFSHEMHHVRTGKKTVSINPRKGETWALFRDWKKEQQQHKRPYRYDFVQIESELDSDHGVGVAYLGKVVGFTSVYELAEQHDCFKMMIPSDEMLRFSHRVPSFVLTGDERKGVPAGSFELDPAAIPKDCLEPLKISSAHDHDESEAQAEAIVKRNMGETRFLQRVTVEPVQPAGPVRWDEELVERCLSHAAETATGMLDLSGQVREYKEMMVESVRKQSLEMEEKEKESDLRRSLEAELLMLVLEMQMVEEVVEREFRVREEKHEEREKVVRKLGENVQERCNEMEKREEEFQLKAKDVEVKRKELELKEKRREEQFQLRQDSEAKEIEAKMRSLERKDKELEHDDEADDDEDPEPYNCLDADFNNFNNTMRSFSVGQVWALYDPLDHMPRLYAKIKKVLELKMKVEVTWLEAKQKSPIPIACGEFKNGERTVKSYLTFSHLMVDHTGKKKSIITINPRKGETWALFRDWKKQQQKRPYGYDFVQVVSELDSGGIGVAYLGRVEGFTSVYELGEQNGVLQMMVRCDEMLRFSHRVPSFVLTGDERKGVPAGSLELDPAAIPRDYLEASEVKQEE
uniref:DUF3444 domain-containing protein n=1 Tax=Brassica oleracea TaxID=3712 RepID=A0A3P6F5J8_BRAOL|nr:unnamed protein product [Brassica oleracea]